MKPEDLATKKRLRWCPGCGNFGLFEALKRAIVALKLPPEKVLVSYGIGCHGHMIDFLKTNGFHALHGRPLPVAVGAKLVNPALTALVSSGDGDAYSEGLNHLVGAAKANYDVTLLVHNNWSYSLTTGQTSPTTPKGKKTKSTPKGSIETPLNPLLVALAAGATFISRGFTGEIEHLAELIVKAVKHKGFSLVDVLQPCVVFNKEYSVSWFKKRVYKLTDKKRDDLEKALRLAQETEKFPLGVVYQIKKPTFSQGLGLEKPPIAQEVKKEEIGPLLEKI